MGHGEQVHLLGFRRPGTSSQEHTLLPAGTWGGSKNRPATPPSLKSRKKKKAWVGPGVTQEVLGAGVLRRATGRFTWGERTDIWGHRTVCWGRGPCELSHSAPLFLALLNSVVAKTVFKLALERRGGEREGWGERPCLSLEADQMT